MNNKERMAITQWAVEFALKSGADQAAAELSCGRTVEVTVRERTIEKLSESGENSLTLELYAKKRYSQHTTCDLRRSALKSFISQAAAATLYLAEDEFRTLPDPRYYPRDLKKNLFLVDDRYGSVDTAARIRTAKEAEAAALEAGNDVLTATASCMDRYAESVRVHSNGFSGERSGTYFQLSVEATVRDEHGRPDDYAYAASRFFAELPAAEALGREAVERALRKRGGKKAASGRYEVIIENRALGRLLSMLQEPLLGRTLQQKSSYLDGCLETEVASPLLSIYDEPFLPKGFGSRLFDDEGLAAEPRPIIESGVLKSYLIDAYYGRKMNLPPTSGSPSNWRFALGSRSLAQMVADLKRGVLITDFIGGNFNSTTGDFSYGIMGLMIENGEPVHAVNEMNLTGNGREFWRQIIEVGNDPFPYSSLMRPSIRFEGLQLSGL